MILFCKTTFAQGNTIRVNAQLVDARSGFHKWGDTFNRITQEVFAVQHEITHGVIKTLAIILTGKDQQRQAHNAASNLKAYGCFQEGQRLSKNRTKEDNQLAEVAYRKDIEIDQTYDRAYGALAVTLDVEYFRRRTSTPTENLDRALNLAKQVVTIDNSIPQTCWTLGWVYLMRKEHYLAE